MPRVGHAPTERLDPLQRLNYWPLASDTRHPRHVPTRPHGAFFGSRGTTCFVDLTGDGRADAIAVIADTVSVQRIACLDFGPRSQVTSTGLTAGATGPGSCARRSGNDRSRPTEPLPRLPFARGERLIKNEGAPTGVRGLQFYPARNGSGATCLWEADSVEDVQGTSTRRSATRASTSATRSTPSSRSRGNRSGFPIRRRSARKSRLLGRAAFPRGGALRPLSCAAFVRMREPSRRVAGSRDGQATEAPLGRIRCIRCLGTISTRASSRSEGARASSAITMRQPR